MVLALPLLIGTVFICVALHRLKMDLNAEQTFRKQLGGGGIKFDQIPLA